MSRKIRFSIGEREADHVRLRPEQFHGQPIDQKAEAQETEAMRMESPRK